MENKTFDVPTMSKYIIRSTGEEVEVIDSNVVSRGERSDDDWVTYIDSKGVEHIKEHINLQLDFKYGKDFVDLFGKMFDTPKFEPTKFPSIDNNRLYELTKELVINRFMPIDDAYDKAKRIVELCKE